jgi:HK97 family phage major capsid protein
MARSNILALRQRKAEVVRRNQGILSVCERDQREMSDQEHETYDKGMAALKKIEAEIIAEEARLAGEMAMPGLIDDNHAFSLAAQGLPVPENPFARRAASGKRYRDLFGPNLSTDGFKGFDEFLKAWHHTSSGSFDPRLRMSQVEDVPSSGGFAVPTEYAAMLMDKALEAEVVRPRAIQWPMTSETRKVPGLDNFNHAGATLFGGFSVQWLSETAPITPQDLKTRLLTLTANKCALLGQCSNELLSDAVGGFEAIYGAAIIAAIAFWHDIAFLTGDGAGKPRGVLNDPALVVVDKEAGQAAGTVKYENVTKMLARLHPACFNSAVWVVNATAIPQLLLMQNVVKDAAGDIVGGSAVPVVQQADDGSLTLLTRKVVPTEKLPALGSEGDILLADFSQYSIGLRQGAALEKSAHAGFTTDTSYFRVVTRLDGQGTWKTAMTPVNGDSLSWCVTLAART